MFSIYDMCGTHQMLENLYTCLHNDWQIKFVSKEVHTEDDEFRLRRSQSPLSYGESMQLELKIALKKDI